VTTLPETLHRLPLSGIDAVIFYKRDELTTDLICCDVKVRGQVWTFHEEAPDWSDLIAHLSALPGFLRGWHETVAGDPFSRSETVAFDRR
jgi:hypothetical protein